MSPVYGGGGKILCNAAGKPYCDPATGKLVWKITTTTLESVRFQIGTSTGSQPVVSGQQINLASVNTAGQPCVAVFTRNGNAEQQTNLGSFSFIIFYGNSASVYSVGTMTLTGRTGYVVLRLTFRIVDEPPIYEVHRVWTFMDFDGNVLDTTEEPFGGPYYNITAAMSV